MSPSEVAVPNGATAPPPSIAVVMPLMDARQDLEEAIDSVLAQTLPASELIVVNCVSGAQVLPGLAKFKDRIKVVPCAARGISAARNVGAEYARSSFIAFNDNHGIWHPRKLEQQLAWMQQHPDCDLVHTGCSTTVNGKEVSYLDKPLRLTAADLLLTGHAFVNTMLLRREVMSRSDGFDTTFSRAEGYEFAFRLVDQGYNLDFLALPLVYLKPEALAKPASWHEYFTTHARVVWRNRKHYQRHAGRLGTWQHLVRHLYLAGSKQSGLTGALLRVVAKVLYPFPLPD